MSRTSSGSTSGSSGRTPLIAGNWKMNGTKDMARAFFSALEPAGGVEILVCPPMTLIRESYECAPSSIKIGAQDCHEAEEGAYTGCVSAPMLAGNGASYVIVGHSERRQYFGETDELVAEKALAAHIAGLSAIICVGETLEEREAGKTLEIVTEQVGTAIPSGCDAHNTVIAYEPVWAIGTGKVATLEQIQEVHAAIRGIVGQDMRILYGGSMKPGNAAEILALPDVDGGLIGGASLKADDFQAIINTAATEIAKAA